MPLGCNVPFPLAIHICLAFYTYALYTSVTRTYFPWALSSCIDSYVWACRLPRRVRHTWLRRVADPLRTWRKISKRPSLFEQLPEEVLGLVFSHLARGEPEGWTTFARDVIPVPSTTPPASSNPHHPMDGPRRPVMMRRHGYADLCACALTCRTWTRAANDILYTRIILRSPYDLAKFARTCGGSTGRELVGRRTHTLELPLLLPLPDEAEMRYWDWQWDRERAQARAMQLRTVLRACANLRVLGLMVPRFTYSSTMKHPDVVMEALDSLDDDGELSTQLTTVCVAGKSVPSHLEYMLEAPADLDAGGFTASGRYRADRRRSVDAARRLFARRASFGWTSRLSTISVQNVALPVHHDDTFGGQSDSEDEADEPSSGLMALRKLAVEGCTMDAVWLSSTLEGCPALTEFALRRSTICIPLQLPITPPNANVVTVLPQNLTTRSATTTTIATFLAPLAARVRKLTLVDVCTRRGAAWNNYSGWDRTPGQLGDIRSLEAVERLTVDAAALASVAELGPTVKKLDVVYTPSASGSVDGGDLASGVQQMLHVHENIRRLVPRHSVQPRVGIWATLLRSDDLPWAAASSVVGYLSSRRRGPSLQLNLVKIPYVVLSVVCRDHC